MPPVQIPDALSALQPEPVWRHFAAFAARPRPSGLEQQVREYVLAWAGEHGFDTQTDAIGNVVVRVPGRGKGVDAPTVIMQGHMDMVCEKNEDTVHDFEVDPINLIQAEGVITADGTTLGADNGIGVALSMAAAEGMYENHPPLELLLTVDEETGMSGARELDASMLTAKRMINLDAEEEGTLYVGCAGGQDILIDRDIIREAVPEGFSVARITLKGLKGGHSGLDIIKNRGNATRLLVHALRDLRGHDDLELRLIALDGGSKRNAIPREASAIIATNDAARIAELLPALGQRLLGLHADSETAVNLAIEPSADERGVMSFPDEAAIEGFVHIVPGGVITMSQAVPGLVETSNNLGVVTTEGDRFHGVLCARSSNDDALRTVVDRICQLADLLGIENELHGGYPGWQPNLASEMLSITKDVFTELAGGADPEVTAIHAGLECGLLGAVVPGLDMISFGPDIRNAHSPDEEVSITSVAVVAEQVGALLEALCER